MFPDFKQWLSERGIRTAQGPYPPAYGAGNYPPEYHMPISATAALSLQNWHPEVLSKKKRKRKSDKKAD